MEKRLFAGVLILLIVLSLLAFIGAQNQDQDNGVVLGQDDQDIDTAVEDLGAIKEEIGELDTRILTKDVVVPAALQLPHTRLRPSHRGRKRSVWGRRDRVS